MASESAAAKCPKKQAITAVYVPFILDIVLFAGFKSSLSVMVEYQIVHARNLLIYIETVE